MKTENYTTYSEEDTIALGKDTASRFRPGDVVAFYGDLGAGKTEFIKGVCNFFEVEEIVTSPTFTIINQYSGSLQKKDITIYHIDLYRIHKTEELDDIGFEECVHSDGSIKLIEWAEKAAEKLGKADYKIKITHSEKNEDKRLFSIEIADS